MSVFVYFTPQEKETARNADIAEMLERQGERLKRSGSEYEWGEGSERVTIRGNLWYHQYEQKGGNAAIYALFCKFSLDVSIYTFVRLSRMKTNLNLPQSRRFRPFRQMLARCIDIHLRSPLAKIIKNGGFEVASEFNGKKTIKTRQSSDVVHAYYERE